MKLLDIFRLVLIAYGVAGILVVGWTVFLMRRWDRRKGIRYRFAAFAASVYVYGTVEMVNRLGQPYSPGVTGVGVMFSLGLACYIPAVMDERAHRRARADREQELL